MTTSPVERAADQFVTALAQWRVERGMTKKQLAARMGFDPSYVSHVEGRRHKPTEDFARRAEAVLAAGGAIWQRFQEYDELRHARNTPSHRDPPVPAQWLPPGTGLIVEQEVAELAYTERAYRVRVRRSLYNAGNEPVTRYLMKIGVDRYPHDPTGSNRHHREHRGGRRRGRRARADGLAAEAGPGRVERGVAAVRERARSVPSLSR